MHRVTTDQLIDCLTTGYGTEIDTNQVRAAAQVLEISYPTACKKLEEYKIGRGKWNLTVVEKLEKQLNDTDSVDLCLIPDKDASYVSYGNFGDIKKIIQSRRFYPTFITGLSGNGKTLSVEQACAALNRELIRVNITIETDEDDLIGGFRLVNGETVWHNGPVVEALERGAVLLLDEIDLASNKILCLQSVLEGKGIFLKKIGKYVRPAIGFNVIATANTKGKGSDDGRFIGTNMLNEAFLERFPITFEQEYPTNATETKILLNAGCDPDFADNLIKWAGAIRKTFFDGGCDEIITTRRLVHIVQAYDIFGDRLDAITKCVNRFDDDTKQSFLDLYTKVDAGEDSEYNEEEETI
ncbi:porphyrin biosynthetic protein [Synechococcus phage S-MbCM6]|uniref:Porphyrin biosynthetic protein n=1 Tax=Synechococcus phage S-MbCM6 TaxID=3126011 RepID=A0A0E3HCK0_9CAUD|nr:porphyrin biosynthetic protein [Synechococcus phage ACG-2014c]